MKKQDKRRVVSAEDYNRCPASRIVDMTVVWGQIGRRGSKVPLSSTSGGRASSSPFGASAPPPPAAPHRHAGEGGEWRAGGRQQGRAGGGGASWSARGQSQRQ